MSDLQVIIPLDEAIKEFDPVAAGLSALREKYVGATIKGVEDKEGYEFVKKGISELVSTRTSIDPIKKRLTERARDFTAKVNKEADRIVSELKVIELPMKAEKERVDALILEQKQAKANAEIEEFNRRVNVCIEKGMTFMDGKYTIANISVTAAQIKGSAPEKFDLFIKRVEQEQASLVRAMQEHESAQAKELEEFQKQKAELAKQQKEVNDERKRLEDMRTQLGVVSGECGVEGGPYPYEDINSTMSQEPVRSPEEATEENNYAKGVPDRAKLANFARYLEFNMPPMVPVVQEEWAVAIADKMREQLAKMSAYITDRLPPIQ